MQPCLWLSHRVAVEAATSLVPVECTVAEGNKKRRYRAYQFFASVINEGPGGPRVRIPDCCKDGVHALYPDPEGHYVGHKDN